MNETFSRIRYERERRGWSQQDLADHVEATPVSVSRWERGEVIPSPYYRKKLSSTFGRPIEELLPAPFQKLRTKQERTSNTVSSHISEITGLKSIRIERALSQQELAVRIGTTRVSVNRWENGQAFPNPYYVRRLCDFFEMTREDLFPNIPSSMPPLIQQELERTPEPVGPSIPEGRQITKDTHLHSRSGGVPISIIANALRAINKRCFGWLSRK